MKLNIKLRKSQTKNRAKYHKINIRNHKTETGKNIFFFKILLNIAMLCKHILLLFGVNEYGRISLGTFIKPGSEIKSSHHKILRVAEGSRKTTQCQRWQF